MDHTAPLWGRLKRYASVSSMATSFGARLVGERFLGIPIDNDAQAQALTQAFGALKGPLMKVAQFLATIPDAIPEPYATEFLQLQSQAPSMGWPFVRRRMTSELGSEWMSHFDHFTREAVAAASLGQVHQGILKNGQKVACKLQYPDMNAAVQGDLNQLKVGFKVFENLSGALRFEEILQEIADRLYEELDYTLEAKHMALYNLIFKDYPFINIPISVPKLSTSCLLTMAWCEGEPPLKFQEKATQEGRNQLAKNLFHAWYYPFYHYGVIHGDPHLGNYLFSDNGSISLLDFGCIRKFKPSFVMGVLDLFYAFLDNRPEQAVAAYEGWGFQGLTIEKIEVLNLWAKMLYEPLLEDIVRPIQKNHRGLQGKATAEAVHGELKRLGGVTPPKEFVFMDRAAVGIGSAFMHLQAENNWHQLFMALIDGVNIDSLQASQCRAFKDVGL